MHDDIGYMPATEMLAAFREKKLSPVEVTSALLERIDAKIDEDRVSRVHLRVPQKEGKMLAMLAARARIYSRKYKDGAVELEAEAPESVVRKVRDFVIG